MINTKNLKLENLNKSQLIPATRNNLHLSQYSRLRKKKKHVEHKECDRIFLSRILGHQSCNKSQ